METTDFNLRWTYVRHAQLPGQTFLPSHMVDYAGFVGVELEVFRDAVEYSPFIKSQLASCN